MASDIEINDEAYYYIESDGKVFLVEISGELCFPRKKDKLPFAVVEKKVMVLNGETIVYCGPVLEKHPQEWLSKDEIPGLDNVHRLVRQCLHMSFPRTVAEAIILKDGQVLLVNASRGVTVGFWNLPGGFMEYGESPEECIVREVAEEIGVSTVVKELVGVYDRQSSYHPYHLIAFVYLCDVDSFDLKPAPDEIAEVGWFEIDDAISRTKSHFTRLALTDFKRDPRS